MARPIHILLVEDSPTDQLIAKAALQRSGLSATLTIVESGEQALARLRGDEALAARADRPDLVLLDHHLPGISGLDTLRELKSDPRLHDLPVLMLSSSRCSDDVRAAYAAHASGYVCKPVDFSRFTDTLRAIGAYWSEVVVLPEPVAPQHLPEFGDEALPTPLTLQILLLEDSPTDALILRTGLELLPAEDGRVEVRTTATLADALEALECARFDAVLADLHLPDSDGLETVRALTRSGGDTPVLVLTGASETELGQQAIRHGAEDYLEKGHVTPRHVHRALRYAVERRRARTQLARAHQSETVGRLTAAVAHDVNNLLTVIRSAAELLLTDPPRDERVAGITDLIDATRRGAQLTRKLLTTGDQDNFAPRPIDLGALVEELSPILRRFLGTEIDYELQVTDDLPRVLADPSMIEQVLLNLVINARDAMSGSGTLRIRVARRPGDVGLEGQDCVTLHVQDTGCGIAPEVQDTLFEPYVTTKADSGGSGLGLSSVRAIVRLHAGELDVSSIRGHGATFQVHWPVARLRPRKLPAPPPAAPVTEPRIGRVLLVDDDDAVRRLLQRLLARAGHEVHVASDGPGAVQLWEELGGAVDLLLTDLMLGGPLDGRTLATQLQQRDPGLRAVFCSGYSPDFADPEVRLVEGENFVPKPFEPRTLLDTVSRALGGDLRRTDAA